MSSDPNPDLESFREQWRAEVRARHPAPAPAHQPQPQPLPQTTTAGPSTTIHTLTSTSSASTHPANAPRKPPPPPTKKPAPAAGQDGDDDYVQPRAFDEPAAVLVTGQVSAAQPETATPTGSAEPASALEHYEKAVEREAVGKLGDSLSLYRKAFRMDDAVDQKYKNKHFPRPPVTAASKAGGAAEGAAPAGKAEASAGGKGDEKPQSMKDLIMSFSSLSIQPAPAPVEGMPKPPCPISELPDEILVHILRDVAVLDIGDFVRLAQVCKRLAFLVSTEDRIWRRVCLGREFGFGGMHYHWQRQVTWGELTGEDLIREAEEEAGEGGEKELEVPTPRQRAEKHEEESLTNSLAFHQSLYSTWQRMFRLRPRIRFNGCYISTVNYIRAGMHNSNSISWGSPVHIVTYYRYLRFFRDGTAISLLTTAEPTDVVHHLTREAVALHTGGAAPHLPSIVVQSALRGRWRLAHARDNPHASLSEVEGDLIVETEGVSKYIYRLDLALRNAGKLGTKNNKLVWRGFYSYNRLTDDWAEFALKNDKPFYFSRVRSYGVMGE